MHLFVFWVWCELWAVKRWWVSLPHVSVLLCFCKHNTHPYPKDENQTQIQPLVWSQPLLNNLVMRACMSKSPEDWLAFRKIRNQCTQAIRKEERKDKLLSRTIQPQCLKPTQILEDCQRGHKCSPSQLPPSLMVNNLVIAGKECVAEAFNNHFVKAGNLFDLTTSSVPAPIYCPPNVPTLPILTSPAVSWSKC